MLLTSRRCSFPMKTFPMKTFPMRTFPLKTFFLVLSHILLLVQATKGLDLTLLGPSGVITSPNYPAHYDNLANESWLIRSEPGCRIQLKILRIKTECFYDDVIIYDGSDSSADVITRRCSKQLSPVVVTSTSSAMYVTFTSDWSITFPGFYMRYSVLDCLDACKSRFIRAPMTNLTSSDHLVRKWTLVAQPGQHVIFNITKLFIQCKGNNSLSLYDGSCAGARQPLMDVCDRSEVDVIASSQNVMCVMFNSDSNEASIGFVAKYTCLSCNERLTNWTGVIRSPLHPRPYNLNANCSWLIEAKKGDIIILNFVQVSTECPYDVLILYDGNNSSRDEYLYQGCDLPVDTVIPSTTNFVLVTFTSDLTITGQGFVIQYSFYKCHDTLTNSNGTLSSPNYPQAYPNNIQCSWILAAEEGSKIILTLETVDIECGFDYLTVYDGASDKSALLGKFCHVTNHTLQSSSSHLLVTFSTDDMFTKAGGFKASYYQL